VTSEDMYIISEMKTRKTKTQKKVIHDYWNPLNQI